MALLGSEIQRIRQELGYNVLGIGAEPYVDYHAIFDQVVQTYINTGASTTSSTSVAASTTPAPVTLTLADSTDFAAGMRIVVDVDDRQEPATIQDASGSTITVLLTKTHSGTYPVATESGESIVREILRKLSSIANQIAEAFSTAGIKKVDEIEWFGDSATNQMTTLERTRMYWRDELAGALGVTNLWRVRAGGGNVVSLY